MCSMAVINGMSQHEWYVCVLVCLCGCGWVGGSGEKLQARGGGGNVRKASTKKILANSAGYAFGRVRDPNNADPGSAHSSLSNVLEVGRGILNFVI